MLLYDSKKEAPPLPPGQKCQQRQDGVSQKDFKVNTWVVPFLFGFCICCTLDRLGLVMLKLSREKRNSKKSITE
jgi:hypothetical protein